MALPIIVPAWDFDPQNRFQSAHALPSKRLPPRSVRIPRPLDAAGGSTREPCERELLILRWRCSAKVWPSTPPCWKVDDSMYCGQANDRERADYGVSLLATCEWLLRKRLRQEWALLCRVDRSQVFALVSRFKRNCPIISASDLVADAAAWTLFAMYWCGAPEFDS